MKNRFIPELKSYLIMLLMGFIFIIFSCYSPEDQENIKLQDEIIENEMWLPKIILTRKNKKMIEAISKKLYNKNESALLVGDVEVDFFNDEGIHISTLFADSARIDEQNNDLNATGNVYVVSDSGYTLRTSKIIWNNNYQMIIAEDSVMFTTTEGDTLYGLGFESDSDLEEWRIFKPFGITREGI